MISALGIYGNNQGNLWTGLLRANVRLINYSRKIVQQSKSRTSSSLYVPGDFGIGLTVYRLQKQLLKQYHQIVYRTLSHHGSFSRSCSGGWSTTRINTSIFYGKASNLGEVKELMRPVCLSRVYIWEELIQYLNGRLGYGTVV